MLRGFILLQAVFTLLTEDSQLLAAAEQASLDYANPSFFLKAKDVQEILESAGNSKSSRRFLRSTLISAPLLTVGLVEVPAVREQLTQLLGQQVQPPHELLGGFLMPLLTKGAAKDPDAARAHVPAAPVQSSAAPPAQSSAAGRLWKLAVVGLILCLACLLLLKRAVDRKAKTAGIVPQKETSAGKAADEAAKKKAAAEASKKAAEEAARKKAADAEASQKAAEEARLKEAEQAARKKASQEAARKTEDSGSEELEFDLYDTKPKKK
eukprot:TRINITY_DN8297_c0_g2_i1.p1 TRINITY_DN8297_c0_g2~~TRINITY_DN8297_c0_g2_i1.p1  ORF type:complete len:286 (-),score=79.69 TRINITY_DN8297_c0_g2_i1:154-954(-)